MNKSESETLGYIVLRYDKSAREYHVCNTNLEGWKSPIVVSKSAAERSKAQLEHTNPQCIYSMHKVLKEKDGNQ